MAYKDLVNPKGELPMVDATLLPDQYASIANNMDGRQGTFKPIKLPLDSGQSLNNSTKTLYRFNRDSQNTYWFQFDNVVNVVKGPVIDDQDELTYITGNGSPKFTSINAAQQGSGPYPAITYDLGIPKPLAFTATGSTAQLPDGAQQVDVSYTIVFKGQFGELGPPADPTITVVRWDGSTTVLTNLPVPTGSYVGSTKLIYRSELNDSFQLVAEIPASQTTFNDDIVTASMGDVLVSTDWFAPDSNMIGLTEVGNGVLLGFYDYTIAFCEPYQPHAWPPAYELAIADKPVAAVATSNGLLIGTQGKPVFLQGSTPGSMREAKIDEVRPCESARSMVDMGEYAIFASTDGLVAIGGNRAELITAGIMLPEQWQALNPSTIHAVRLDDRYLAFYDGGSFIFSQADGFIFFSIEADASYLDGETVYIKQGTQLMEWDAGNASSMVWQTKRWQTPRQEFVKCLKVNAEGDVTVEIFQDNLPVKTATIQDSKAIRIPALARYELLQLRFTSQSEIKRIQLASSMSELQ